VNVTAVLAFLACTTQWRCVCLANGKVLVVGLDYAGAKAGLKMAGIKVKPSRWSDVRQIELGAMEEMNRTGR
jgi:hypothetical protein